MRFSFSFLFFFPWEELIIRICNLRIISCAFNIWHPLKNGSSTKNTALVSCWEVFEKNLISNMTCKFISVLFSRCRWIIISWYQRIFWDLMCDLKFISVLHSQNWWIISWHWWIISWYRRIFLLHVWHEFFISVLFHWYRSTISQHQQLISRYWLIFFLSIWPESFLLVLICRNWLYISQHRRIIGRYSRYRLIYFFFCMT